MIVCPSNGALISILPVSSPRSRFKSKTDVFGLGSVLKLPFVVVSSLPNNFLPINISMMKNWTGKGWFSDFDIVDVWFGLRNLLTVWLFARARFSAALSFFSSLLSLASSSDRNSFTMLHSPGERSSMRTHFLSVSSIDKIFFSNLLVFPFSKIFTKESKSSTSEEIELKLRHVRLKPELYFMLKFSPF